MDGQNMTPEELDELLESLGTLGTADDELEGNARQMALADALRGTAMPEGRNAGGTFVASNPLEVLSASMSRIKGAKDAKTAEAGRTAILDRIKGARKGLAGAYMKQPQPEGPFGFSAPEWIEEE